jgi:molecular chaperone DnaK
VEKNATVPLVKSFRLPPPREPGATTIEMDIYQGDSEHLVDNEYLGSLRMPAAFAGRRIDFKLDAECLLTVSVDDPTRGMQPIALATRDTPPQLRAALAKDQADREERAQTAASSDAAPDERRGLLSSIRRIWGGGD